MPENYIGIMCGTSLDSLDLSLCDFEKNNKVKYFKSYKIHQSLRDKINECKNHPNRKKLFIETDKLITEFIIESVRKFITASNTKKITAIGYPGITIIHNPKKKISKTLGNPAMIAKESGLSVVADFRLTDMKHGGQGAPLAPYFHEYISSKGRNFLNFINLGGFANLTYRSNNKLMAFDTGPANYLINEVAKKYFKKDYDKNGLLAKRGRINDRALMSMLSDKYFYQNPPKSTGFEKFNIQWVEKYKDKFQLNRNSLIATLTQLTSISVSDAINFNNLDSDKIFFAGGGSKNPIIKREILKRTGLDEIKSLPWGLDFKNIESSAFAWLAMTRVKGKPISKGYITGAKNSRLLGIIYR
jgi:anhydro-N-acetylmuramic acid kinase